MLSGRKIIFSYKRFMNILVQNCIVEPIISLIVDNIVVITMSRLNMVSTPRLASKLL